MLLKVGSTRHMDCKSYHSSQPIQANGISGHGQSVADSELGRFSAQFNGQFLSDPAYKRRRSAFHRQHATHK
jgi:hypothetical protein